MLHITQLALDRHERVAWSSGHGIQCRTPSTVPSSLTNTAARILATGSVQMAGLSCIHSVGLPPLLAYTHRLLAQLEMYRSLATVVYVMLLAM